MDTAVQKDVEIYAEIVKETRTSYYISDWKGTERHILKSKVKAKKKIGKQYMFIIPEVLAIQKGFI